MSKTPKQTDLFIDDQPPSTNRGGNRIHSLDKHDVLY